jgi:hypothetical protein
LISGCIRCLIAAVFVILLISGLGPDADAQPPETPSLTDIVLVGLRPVKGLEWESYPKTAQPCLQKYLGAVGPGSWLLTFEAPSRPEEAMHVKRRNLAEQMVVILGENVRSEAEAFARAAPLITEWEKMSEGPVDEANFVDNWLSKRPGTVIEPFLYLFKVHRLRAGYEAAKACHEKGLWPILAKRYREALDRVRSDDNPLISCIADDLEAQAYVYLEGHGRP